MSETELAPCPFCAGAGKTTGRDRYWWIECTECGVEMSGFSVHEAAKLWNRRASDEPAPDELHPSTIAALEAGEFITEAELRDSLPPAHDDTQVDWKAKYRSVKYAWKRSCRDWIAMLREVAGLSDAMGLGDGDWVDADDDTLLEQFDPWYVIREAKKRVKPDERAPEPTERMWRTLVRVDDLTQAGDLSVTVPAFNPTATAFVTDAPRKVIEAVDELPKRFHARVNLGAAHVRDLRFEDWEVPPEPTEREALAGDDE